MLVEFSAENFRSIKGRVTLSMIAAKLRSRDEQLDRDNVIDASTKVALLRSAVIYGANASGKSNILKAFRFMRSFVRDSARQQDEDRIRVEPFRLNTTTLGQPSTFEAVFLLDGLQYRYGFSLTSKRVIAEWLYYIPNSREVELFTRNHDMLNIGSSFREGRGLDVLELDLTNKLLLSVVAGLKAGETAKRVRQWFINTCRSLQTDSDTGYRDYTLDCIEKGRYHYEIESLVSRLDLDITRLSVVEVPLPESLSQLHDVLVKLQGKGSNDDAQVAVEDGTPNRTVKELHTHHSVRDDEGRVVADADFRADTMESQGTQKIIALSGPLRDVLSQGMVLFLDEIDARLHPMITAAIVRLFNSPETNPNNAQLICVTHDTNLLDRHLFRRDQIYFVEKDEVAATHLYSLADFKLESAGQQVKGVRNDASFEKNYIQGRYGAIPYLGNIDQWFSEQLRGTKKPAETSVTLQEVAS